MKSECEFWVVMVARKDGMVYCDLSKCADKIFVTENNAIDFLESIGEAKKSFTIVKMIAKIAQQDEMK